MRRSGKASLLLILAIAGVIALFGALFLFKGESYTSSGTRFLSALANQDVNELAAVGVIGSDSPDEMRKKWETTFKYAKYYKFIWQVKRGAMTSDDEAVLEVAVFRNFDMGGYDEKYEVPLRKVDGKWLVQVSGISRKMFPYLPK